LWFFMEDSGDLMMSANLSSSPGDLSVQERPGELLAVTFRAMGSPCEVLLHGADAASALELGQLVAQEAWRVEGKYSRYRDDSVVASIHRQRGTEIEVDAETASLLDFAKQCFELTDGLFDITSGVLRRVWTFDGSDHLPDPASVEALLSFVGFEKLSWRSPHLLLPVNMEIDLGGICKEYSVDRAYELLEERYPAAFLVNFGGDLRANRPPPRGRWQVAIERPGLGRTTAMLLEHQEGALATSGNARRFLLRDGKRYGHVLNPQTGWPVPDAPRCVTVAGRTCMEAGLLSTLAMLKGSQAQTFLQEQGVTFWVLK
jgi:thiamine biosynthesis lipoprotein